MKKNFKKLLAIALAVIFVIGISPMVKLDFALSAEQASEGTPLTADVTPVSGGSYTISTAEQLVNLSNIVKAGNECEGATFTLTADIVLNEGTFTVVNGEPYYDGVEASTVASLSE